MRRTGELRVRELLDRLPKLRPLERLLELRLIDPRLLEPRLPPKRLPACVSTTTVNTSPKVNDAATRFLLKGFMILSFSFRVSDFL